MTEEEKQNIIEQLKKGAKRYTCCCGETFSKMYNFRKHLLKRHRKEWDECFEKIKVKSISTDKNLGAHIIETNDDYLFCYSTKYTFKLSTNTKSVKKGKKKHPIITLESAHRNDKKVIKPKKKRGNIRTFDDLFIPLTKHEAKTGIRKEVINKLQHTEKTKQANYVKIIYTPMGNKR